MAITRWQPFRSLERWEPFRDIEAFRKEMDQLLEQFAPGLGGKDGFGFVPSAEMDETDTEIHLKLEVPGMQAEDLDIEVTDEAIAVKGERKSESKTEEEGLIRSEFHYGKFERVVPMPTRIKKDNVVAEYKDGILRLIIPKSEETKEEAVKVKVA
jgi:HSP20 family protein